MSDQHSLSRHASLNLTAVQRASLLSPTPWASSFSPSEIQQTAIYTEAYHITPNTVVFEEGDREAYMCLITSGRVLIYKNAAAGQRALIASLIKDRTFGEMSLIDGQTRSATAITDQDTMLLMLHRTQFDRMAKEEPRVAFKLLLNLSNMMSQRLRQTNMKLVEVLGKNLE